MLVAARDKDGTPRVFRGYGEDFPCEKIESSGCWYSFPDGDLVLYRDSAEPFCVGIPNGESRVIDLAKSTFAYVEPEKTPVQDLVEQSVALLDILTPEWSRGGRWLIRPGTKISDYEKAVDGLNAALARFSVDGKAGA